MGQHFNKFADVVWAFFTGGYAESKLELKFYILIDTVFILITTYLMIKNIPLVFISNNSFLMVLCWSCYPITLFIIISILTRTIIRYRELTKVNNE